MVLTAGSRHRARYAYVAATSCCCGALVAYATVVSASAAFGALALFAAASAVAEYFQVEGADDALDAADARTFSFSYGPPAT